MEELYEALRDHGLDMPEVGTEVEKKLGKIEERPRQKQKQTPPFSIGMF